MFALLFTNYSGESGVLVSLKVGIWLVFSLFGLVIGRQIVHHKILRDGMNLTMFSENKGTWMVMFWTWCITLYFGSIAYNMALEFYFEDEHVDRETKLEDNMVTSNMGITFTYFSIITATGTWLGDILTLFFVFDMMMQKHHIYPYPDWNANFLCSCWGRVSDCCNKLCGVHPKTKNADKTCSFCKTVFGGCWSGKLRLFWFWFLFMCFTSAVITTFVYAATSKEGGDLWGDLLPEGAWTTNEMQRSVLAAVITMLDLVIVMQDWEFPSFDNEQGVSLPGLGSSRIKNRFFKVHITGKWFNYGIIFMVMIFDSIMLKNQILYEPGLFGQYTGPDGRIWTLSERSLRNVTEAGSEFRANHTGGCTGPQGARCPPPDAWYSNDAAPSGIPNDCVCGAYNLRQSLGFHDDEGVMVTLDKDVTDKHPHLKPEGMEKDIVTTCRWLNVPFPQKLIALLPAVAGIGTFIFLLRSDMVAQRHRKELKKIEEELKIKELSRRSRRKQRAQSLHDTAAAIERERGRKGGSASVAPEPAPGEKKSADGAKHPTMPDGEGMDKDLERIASRKWSETHGFGVNGVEHSISPEIMTMTRAKANLTVPVEPARKPPHVSWKTTVYVLCNDPNSCKTAQYSNGLMTSTILMSVLSFCMESLDVRQYSWNMDANGYALLETIFVMLPVEVPRNT